MQAEGKSYRDFNNFARGVNWRVNIHIFFFCPTNFFWSQLLSELISKEIRQAKHEYMNIPPTQ